jgi:hydroxyacylglutathione hydrolase
VQGAVLDVRQQAEYEAGHLPGAANIELGSLTDGPLSVGAVSVMCAHGERAMTAASLLVRRGHRSVTALFGGPDDWAVGGRRLDTKP